ncbi:uncharacterized protein LOC114442560 [Parambassis ranga]|uniref:Uncharacterized protein LOC114442560 n=1 Tax=Parambassis ranga TaxID=210632 RepID=A0A6P7J635_9TELE|nr:uncharacterized protein LOC114442560 [Parambassis ranga]
MLGLAALILLSTFSLVQALRVPHQISLTVAERGDDLTLTCSVPGVEVGLLYWFKLNFEYTVETVAIGSFDKITLEEQIDKSRFRATKVGNVYSLIITNVSPEDDATYICQAGSAYTMTIVNGTVLAVKDPKSQQKPIYIKQSSDVESVHLGDTVNLQCSLSSSCKEHTDQCPGQHSVHWFRAGSESRPGIIYSDSSSREEERTCVYHLSKTIRQSSDAGTYYCAVVTCGQILFGDGTTVETRQKLDPAVVVLGILLALCVIVIAILIFSRD